MKPALYISPEGVIKYIADLPEEPTIIEVVGLPRGKSRFKLRLEYDTALAAAKESAIEFVDQKEITSILRRHYSDGNLLWSPGIDTIHPFPSDQYEVTIIDAILARMFSLGNTHKSMPVDGQVAVITPSSRLRENAKSG